MAIVFTLGSRKEDALRTAKAGMAAAAFMLCSLASIPALAADPVLTLTAASGEVVHVRGTLSVTRADGTMLVLSQKSGVYPGDLLSTQKDSYARINFTDGSALTIRPYTQVKVESYNYVPDKPQEDSAFFRLVKGGMRSVTGWVGKRGNQGAYRIGTAMATIGIRGSTGTTFQCAPSCEGVANGGEILESGTYHETHSGLYTMQTGDAVAEIAEGQSGYSNGIGIKVTVGGMGDGKVDLSLPSDGGLQDAAICK